MADAPGNIPAALRAPGTTIAGTDVTLTAADPAARYSLRARDPAALSAAIGMALPQAIGETRDGIAKLGPDEWFAVLAAGTELPQGAGMALSVVDISARSLAIIVEGAGAERVIGSGCPLDLAKFAPGRATRTVYETVEIVLWRESAARFRIEVWRSFAPWLWGALSASI